MPNTNKMNKQLRTIYNELKQQLPIGSYFSVVKLSDFSTNEIGSHLFTKEVNENYKFYIKINSVDFVEEEADEDGLWDDEQWIDIVYDYIQIYKDGDNINIQTDIDGSITIYECEKDEINSLQFNPITEEEYLRLLNQINNSFNQLIY